MLKRAAIAMVVVAALVSGIFLWRIQKRRAGSDEKNDPAVLAYGYGPQPNPHVRYQPDVVLIGGGPHSVRGVSDDGLTWTIDASAPGASELQVGKVMFATSQAVGRVLAIQSKGRELAVTLGPIGFTEVVRDAKLNFTVPLNPDEMTFHAAPVVTAHERPPESEPVFHPALWQQARRGPRLHLVGATKKLTFPKVKVGNWEIEAFMKGKGPGAPGESIDEIVRGYLPTAPGGGSDNVPPPPTEDIVSELGLKMLYVPGSFGGKYKYNEDPNDDPKEPTGNRIGVSEGLKFGGVVRLTGEKIKIRAAITVVNGQVQPNPTFVLEGPNKLTIGLLGGAENGSRDNLNARIEVPIDFMKSLPPAVTGGPPLAVQIKFKFLVETAFSGANSTLWTQGIYRLDGALGVEHGQPIVPSLSVEKPMMNNLHGIQIGVSGVVAAVEFRFLVGFGNEIFVAGPYAKFIVATGVTKGSVLAFGLGGLKGGPTCRSVTLKLDLGVGVATVFDPPSIDRLQKLFPGLKKIEAELFETSYSIFNKGYFAPDIPLCRPGGSG